MSNDIAVNFATLLVSTSLGIGTYNIQNQSIKHYAIGHSVGRISLGSAVDSKARLVHWPKTRLYDEKTLQLKLSYLRVNGVNQPIEALINDGSIVELAASANVFTAINTQYRLRVNDRPWTEFSSSNKVTIVPQWDKNTIHVQAKNGTLNAETQFTFYVPRPWYGTYWAFACYLLAVSIIVLVIRQAKLKLTQQYLHAKQRFFNSIANQRTKRHQHSQYLQELYQKQLGNIAKTVNESNQRMAFELFERNQKLVKREYGNIIQSLSTVEVFLDLDETSKAKELLKDASLQLIFEASYNIPDALLSDDLGKAVENLAILLKDQSPLLHIEFNCHDLPKSAVRFFGTAYKSIYEIINFAVYSKAALTIYVNVSVQQEQLIVNLCIEDVELYQSDFTQTNIQLYEVLLLTHHVCGQLQVKTLDKIRSTSIELSYPLTTKLVDTQKQKKSKEE